MKASAVRDWLGVYVLILTALVGGYLFIAPRALVPLEQADRVASIEIIVPFLLGQTAAVYRFFTHDGSTKRAETISIRPWLVKLPILLVSALLAIELLLMGAGSLLARADITPSPEAFKGVLTFCVALLNASTVFLITKYFGTGVRETGGGA
jgi:hypothetical protein